MNKANHFFGLFCITAGCILIFVALGSLLFRLLLGLMALSLINYGLRLRGLPPLQILVPLILSRHGRRWF